MMNKVYLGIDIGGTAAKFGLVDENGNILQRDEFSVSFDGYETPILKTVTGFVYLLYTSFKYLS